MKGNVTVVCHHEHGAPAKVAKVERWPVGEVKPSEALVMMKASPISPADLNVLEGRYAVQPPLPAVVGNEGVGVVAQVGIAVSNVRVGQQVIRPGHMGHWCEAYVAPAKDLVVVPPGVDLELASMATVNVTTAWRLLHDFSALKRGDWIAQNASNSAVGRLVIQLSKSLGLCTACIVRRPELKEELLQLGATAVLEEKEVRDADVAAITSGKAIRLGLNAIGGDGVRKVSTLVADHGVVVTYGGMGAMPLTVGAGPLIFRGLTLKGFWITDWYRRASDKDKATMFAELFPLMRNGQMRVPVEKSYALDNAAEAIEHASRERRAGKILFEMN